MKNLSTNVKEKADRTGNAIIEAMGAMSVQYAVSYKGAIVLSGSVGKYDIEETRPPGKDDMYGIGSTGKVYTTAAAMLLVDKGLLDIDKPYRNYVPDFEMADPRYADITPRHLLNHSSGIYGTHLKGAFLFEDNCTFAIDNLLRHLRTQTLKFNPGEFMEYCNDGFQLMELLIERISGLKLSEFWRKYFFEPIGAKNTKTALDDYDTSRMARCTSKPVYCGDLPYETTNLIGTGGVVSTAEDMCLFGQILMGNKILSKESAKMMGGEEYLSGKFWVEDDDGDSVFAYGLGYDNVHLYPFNKVGIKALFKGGDSLMYHAALIVIPELDLAAGCNSTGGMSLVNNMLLIEALRDICLEYGLVKAFPEQKAFEPPIKKAMPSEYGKFAGFYAGSEKSLLVEIKDGEIEMPAMLQNLIPAQKYVYTGEGKFVGRDGKNTILFSEKRDGLTFIQCNNNIEFPGVGTFAWNSLNFQKLAKKPPDAHIAAVWEKRDGKKYVLIDELPKSVMFLNLSSPYTEIKLSVNTEYGYVNGAAIIDENSAKNVLYARDVPDYEFYCDNGTEYLIAKNQHYIDAGAIPCFDAKAVRMTIDAAGFAKLFNVCEDLDGRTITVRSPKNGAFGVYGAVPQDEPGAPRVLKSLTAVTGDKPVMLATGDLLMFAANPGEEFGLAIQ